MENLTVNNISLQVKEYSGVRVVTFKDIDAVHQRPDGTASRNFRTNRERFVEGLDFFKISSDEIRRHKIMEVSPKARGDITLVTETGYLMLVKSFTDDLAWSVQRELVNSYFKARESKKAIESKVKIYMYNGMKVFTLKEIGNQVGLDHSTLCTYLKGKEFIPNNDYYILEGRKLEAFKYSNPGVSKFTSVLTVLTSKGYKKLIARIKGEETYSGCTVKDMIDKIKLNVNALMSMLNVVYQTDLKTDYYGIGASIYHLCNDIGATGSRLKRELAPCLSEA